jgi:LytS/YehU family sensor histidine kinase
VPRNAAVSVGYLWGGPATRTCGIFVGLAGGLRRLTQLGIFSALALVFHKPDG